MTDAGLVPGAPAAPPRRSGSGSTSGRRWAASRSPRSQHEQYLERGLAWRLPHPRARRVRRAPRRPTSASRSTCAGRSCRRPTRARRGAVAIGEALNAIRDGEIDAAIAGGVEVPAVARSRSARSTSSGRWATASTTTRAHAARPMDARSRRVRHGRGRGAARARGGGHRRGPRRADRTPRCWATPRPRTPTTWSSRDPTAGRPARAVTLALEDARVGARRDRLGQRARLVDAHRRHRRGPGDRGVRSANGPRPCPCQRHEGADRPPARRDRGDRGRDGSARRSATGWVPGHGQPRGAGARARRAPAVPPARRAARAATSASCRRRSASAGSTRRSCSAPRS